MKRYLIIFYIFSIGLVSNTYAQSDEQPYHMEYKTSNFMERTNRMIQYAQWAAEDKENGLWSLKSAVDHQVYAIRLFHDGETQKALFHSRRARDLAEEAVIANNEPVPNFGKLTSEDMSFADTMQPADDGELDLSADEAIAEREVIEVDLVRLLSIEKPYYEDENKKKK